jgi:hypothetical protein
MFSLFKKTATLPSLGGIPLKTYSFNFSLNRLFLGVDNVRYDVYLSPDFCDEGTNIVFQLIAKHSQTEDFLGVHGSSIWAKQRDEFKRLYRDIMVGAINRAKLDSEVQIDFLAQTAVGKMLIGEIRGHFETLLKQYRSAIRKAELADHKYPGETQKLKGKLSEILQNRESIIRNVSSELFQYLADVQRTDLKEMREANFGAEAILPDDVLSNPMLFAENLHNDGFVMEEYDVLIGRRLEDPDQYNALILLISRLLGQLDGHDAAGQELSEPAGLITGMSHDPAGKSEQDVYCLKINGWLKQVDNIDILFNGFKSREQYKLLKRERRPEKDLAYLKDLAQEQERRLDFVYKHFNNIGLTKRISASYEMRPIYLDYCPPLIPQQILGALISSKVRKTVVGRLKRLSRLSDRSFSLKPLNRTMKNLNRLSTKEKKAYLIRFLKGISRYHRDLENYKVLKGAMDRVNLTSEEKILNLSRANNTLYEFLLPHEQVRYEKPIINHVVIKADVRGSTDITRRMNERKLNPASYFSMNFFDPISEILAEYDAVKVFIEGDAIILSIFEREDMPEGWYSVARACGIAINMLLIIQRYNANSQKYKLPILELGIGIGHDPGPPTFLFDSDNRIMISPAINLTDRLSSCTKSVRKKIDQKKRPFNLYVFQTPQEEGEEEAPSPVDDVFVRYNVNGIELNRAGFRKLSQEINLKPVECVIPELQEQKLRLYTGKFPTVSGKYQQLVIREDQITEVNLSDLSVIRMTPRRYYEVCTHPRVYEYIRTMT